MKKILKFKLPITPGKHVLKSPINMVTMHISEQSGEPVLWAECDGGDVPRDIHVAWTGHDVPEGAAYLGTVLLENGGYVLHYYLGWAIRETP